MSFAYFTDEEIRDLAQQVIELLGYDSATRSVLIGALPRRYAATLPGGPPVGGAFGVLLDLQAMNTVERLTDGAVPLKLFLQRVLYAIGVVDAGDDFRRKLDELEARSTGAPRVDVRQLPEIQEKIIFQDDMVSCQFMEAGTTVASAVAKLAVPRFDNGVPRTNRGGPMIYLGTGWLIGRGLLITNHHVVGARNEGEAAASEADLRRQTEGCTALFDYDYEGAAGSSAPVKELVAWNSSLDYALLRITEDSRSPLTRASEPVTQLKQGEAVAVNIVQHPDGRPKRYAIRNNLITAATRSELRYFTDTMSGSSGSPVLNDRWQVVALHRGSSFVRGVSFQGRSVAYVNIGTQIDAILADLQGQFSGKIPELGI